jgi:hypothetical protein
MEAWGVGVRDSPISQYSSVPCFTCFLTMDPSASNKLLQVFSRRIAHGFKHPEKKEDSEK